VTEKTPKDKTVVVHRAGTATEAMVIRGLLESAGISSPAPTAHTPFPMRESPKGFRDTDIVVLESDADEARRIISEHLGGTADERGG